MSAPPSKKLRQTSITDSFKVTQLTAVGMGSQQQDGDGKVWKDFSFPKSDKEDSIQTIPNQDHTAESSSGDISSDTMGTVWEKNASVASVSPAHDAEKLEVAAFNSLGTDSTLENSQPMSPSTSKSFPGWTSEDKKSFGTDLRHFHRMPDCFNKEFPKLKHDDRHHVLINPDSILGGANRVPTVLGKKKDMWDPNHVHMPCSVENLYPVDGVNGRKEIRKRWDMIETALKCLTFKPELNVFDIEDNILGYNKRYEKKWDFAMLKEYEKMLLDEQKKDFVNTIKQIALLALKLPDVCTQPIPLLKKHQDKAVTISQYQAACLLANAFFCTFPKRNGKKKGSEYASYPDINFNRLYEMPHSDADSHIRMEKLKCLLNYFRRVTDKAPTGTLTFQRQSLKHLKKDKFRWDRSHTQFTKLHVTNKGTIESEGKGMLQVDFANKFLGGGVLGRGCVQEEIRFLICPELIVSRLFTEELADDECLIMTGCEQYSRYMGYAETFEFVEDFHDDTPRDAWGRRCTSVVAIDALHFKGRAVNSQYRHQFVKRELDKALCGFTSVHKSQKLPAVATGNWGCGAFGGDPRLKAIIQLMAAAEAGRDVCYFTFGDTDLARDIHKLHKYIMDHHLTVGDVSKQLQDYNKKRRHLYGQHIISFILGEDVIVPDDWEIGPDDGDGDGDGDGDVHMEDDTRDSANGDDDAAGYIKETTC